MCCTMKETVSSLTERLNNLEAKKGNISIVQGVVWTYEQLAEVIEKRNKHREIVKVEIKNHIGKGFDYSILYYNEFEKHETN